MTFGYSRDDSSFFQAYEREKVALVDPFEILDWDGVGKLIKIALNEITEEEKEEETDKDETGKPKSRLRRRLRRLAEVSACGEHAGNPKSIEFFVRNKINVVSCSAFRVLGARFAVAKAQIHMEEDDERSVSEREREFYERERERQKKFFMRRIKKKKIRSQKISHNASHVQAAKNTLKTLSYYQIKKEISSSSSSSSSASRRTKSKTSISPLHFRRVFVCFLLVAF